MLGGCGSTKPPTRAADDRLVLAQTAWPCDGHDPQHTRRSTARGPELPSKKWLNHSFFGPGPIILQDGLLFADEFEGSWAGLQPQTGKLAWRTSNSYLSVDEQGTPALLSDGRLIVTGERRVGFLSSRCFVAAISSDGRTLWRTDVGGTKRGLILEPDDVYAGDPAIGPDGTIYVQVHPGDAVCALSPADGSLKWSHAASHGSGDLLVTATGTVLVSGGFQPSFIMALTPRGKTLWQIRTWSNAGGGAVAPDGTLYYVDSGLHAVATDGSTRWVLTKPIGGTESYDFSSDIALGSDGTIYVCDYDWLYAISPAGKARWRARTGSGSGPVVDAAGAIYIQNGAGWLYAVNHDGSIRWRYKVGEPTSSPPIIGGDGTIYLYDGLGETGGMRAIGSAAK